MTITKSKSLTGLIRLSISFVFFVMAGFIAYLWVADEIKTTRAAIASLRTDYIDAQKETIKTQVRQAVEYVWYKKSSTEKRVRKEVKARTYEAYETARYIYEKNKDRLTLEQIKKLVHDALFPAAWDDGRGYYFAESMAGIEMINRNNPELEGQSVMTFQDSKGTFLMKEFIRVARSAQKEGFVSYYYNPPENPRQDVPKISFIKYFKPLDWIIGNGKYIDEEERTIQKEVIDRLEQITYGSGGYLFAATYDGLSLTGPFKGRNMIDFKDSRGVSVVRELIRTARSGGGFVEYISPPHKNRPQALKISYVEPIPAWQWYIGTGLHLDELEIIIQEKENRLKETVKHLFVKCVLIFAAFAGLSLLLVGYLSKKIEGNLTVFADFFRQSASQALPIAEEQIFFSEFKSLARYANQMSRARQRSEKALKESEHRLSAHLHNTPVGAVSWGLDMTVMDWNPAAEKIFGYTRQEAVGRHPADLIMADVEKERVTAIFTHFISGKGKHRHITRNLTKSGKTILCEWTHTLLKTADDEIIGVASLVNDITDKKRSEELLAQSEKMMSIGGLAAGMAHEINNPLAGIIQNTQVMANRLSGVLPANQAAAEEVGTTMETIMAYMEKRKIFNHIEHILKAGRNAASIVENMLSFARKEDAFRKPADLKHLVDQTIELAKNDYNLKKKYDFKRIELIRDFDPDLPPVACDAGKIQQVIFNILKNASEAMASESPVIKTPVITVRIFQQGGMACLAISDNGPGMGDNIRKRVFEPFFTTKQVGQGTGLGLSVSYFIIVDDHQGEMEVISKPGSGTTFTIKLPLT